MVESKNLEQNLDKSNENLNISDVSESLKTDEEISIAGIKQSKKFASESNTDYTIGYIDGYKQAIKDLNNNSH
jgi:hypothetical protein